MTKTSTAVALGCALSLAGVSAQSRSTPAARTGSVAEPAVAMKSLDGNRDAYAGIARQIWGFAEVGYQEEKSSALLASRLESAGFAVQRSVAEIPTAFVASWGSGKPVIAIIGEFDALPGLSQDALPERKPLIENGPGHGCGHHLFGTASMAAALAVKEWLVSTKQPGTVRFYGTPAEEGGSGKVYMVRAGLFQDVDVAIGWHPGDRNDASPGSTLANITGKVRFRGISAHASSAPDRGRSALDGVEAMNNMVNLMREHVPQETRIHYVITRGGLAPNVVPDFAEVYYYARHPDMPVLDGIWDRITKAAEGAALGTGTKVEIEITGLGLQRAAQRNPVTPPAREPREGGGVRLHRRRAGLRREDPDDPDRPVAADWFTEGHSADAAGVDRLGLDRHGRRQLDRAHGADDRGDVGAWYARAQLAGRRRRRHDHRPQGHDGGGENHDADGDSALSGAARDLAGAAGVRSEARGIHLQDASRRSQAGARLPALAMRRGQRLPRSRFSFSTFSMIFARDWAVSVAPLPFGLLVQTSGTL